MSYVESSNCFSDSHATPQCIKTVNWLLLLLLFFSLYPSSFFLYYDIQAMQTGYNFFGVQFFGECYGGAGQYDKYGPSTNCVWLSGAYVGKHWANYVYMLTGNGESELYNHAEKMKSRIKARKQLMSLSFRQSGSTVNQFS